MDFWGIDDIWDPGGSSGSDLFFNNPELATVEGSMDSVLTDWSGSSSVDNSLLGSPELGGAVFYNTSDVGDGTGSLFNSPELGGGEPTGSAGSLFNSPELGGGDGVPVNLSNENPVGGNFQSIGGAAAAIANAAAGAGTRPATTNAAGGSGIIGGLASLINSASQAVTGRPLLSTSTTGTPAQQRQQNMTNMLIIGAIGLGAFLLFKKA